MKMRHLYIIISMLWLNQVVYGDIFSWLEEFFKEDNIALDEKLRTYIMQSEKQGENYEAEKVFSLKKVTTEEACASCISQLLSSSKNDLKQLLYAAYVEGFYPKNKESLTVLITLLSMVMKMKIAEDSPRFDPNTRLFYTEIERLTKIAKEL